MLKIKLKLILENKKKINFTLKLRLHVVKWVDFKYSLRYN